MKINKILMFLSLGLLPMILSGCSTIVNGTSETVSISTSPSDAELVIKNKDGATVYSGRTPAVISLPKASGYFGGETYSIYINKEGYSAKNLLINSEVSGWYVLGNLGFGGLIGWVLVDPISGAMYNLSPKNISETLSKE